MSDFDPVRQALRVSMTNWAVLEVRGDLARVLPAPDLDLLVAELDRQAPGWSLGWGCDHVGETFVVRASLGLGEVRREGLSQGPTMEDAKLAALADLARTFGVTVGGEEHWVPYDPEEGAEVSELPTPELRPGGASAAAPVPTDPQENARRHIEELLEELRAAGKGAAATRIVIRGYGETLEESRAIYKQLRAILEQDQE